MGKLTLIVSTSQEDAAKKISSLRDQWKRLDEKREELIASLQDVLFLQKDYERQIKKLEEENERREG